MIFQSHTFLTRETTWLFFFLLLAIFVLLLFRRLRKKRPRSWRHFESSYPAAVSYSVFLIGDTGEISEASADPLFLLLSQQLADAGKESSVIFLGDNIYPRGLPEENHPKRMRAELVLRSQLELLKNCPGEIFFISGNHDWNKGRIGGLEYVRRQEVFVEELLGRGNVFIPDYGCPGPHLVEREDLSLIFINTQWWVQKGDKPIGKIAGCTVENEDDFFRQLQQILQNRKTRHVLVAGHHPLFSNALHGGRFTLKHHLFPLTAANKKLYFPLPVAGSLYPLYRKYFGAVEDMSYPPFRKLRKRLLAIFNKCPGLVYIAGHDHNLQHFRKGSQHFLVSGSGSKASFVHPGKRTSFTAAVRGYFRIVYLENGEAWIEAWIAGAGGKGQRIYSAKLY